VGLSATLSDQAVSLVNLMADELDSELELHL